MVAKTFTLAGGGSWETAANWTPTGVPGAADDANLTNAVTGTYSVTISSATEQPNSITINDPTATLVVAGNGIVLGSTINVTAGTLALNGLGLSNTVTMAAGGVFTPSAGTLDGATWYGAFTGIGGSAAYSVTIKDGISLFNLAGTGPGTIDIGSLYVVNVADAVPLNNMTVSFDAVNNEYLNGSNAFALNLGANLLVTQSLPSASGQITGLQLKNAGTMNLASNAGSFFVSSGTEVNTGAVLISNSDHATFNSSFRNSGTVSVSGSALLTIGTNGTSSNATTIGLASAGTLIATGNLLGAGTITLATFAVADVHNVAGTVIFQDGKDTMKLEAPTTFTGTIGGFQKGDKIDMPGQTITQIIPAFPTSAGGTLTVMNGASLVATLNLVGDYTTSTFSFGSDGQTGFQVTVACYAAGTRLLTPWGEVAVETLVEGDSVLALAGAAPAFRPVRWIGRSRIDLARHADPEAVSPVRIRAGAMGDGVPHRDLLVSPDHAILLDGRLIPAHCLVNGATILREAPVGVVEYFHVELDRHDILLAEGLAAESYLDTGNRSAFGNAAVPALHPDFAADLHDAAWRERACRPLVVAGEAVDAAHAMLLRRAVTLGHAMSEDPGLSVEADGVVLAVRSVAPGRWTVTLPAARRLRLRSRRMALDDRGLLDGRRSGVPVAGLRLDGVALSLGDSALAAGFHPLEEEHGACWRWTDGDAALAFLEGVAAGAVLEITAFTGWRRYWVDGTDEARAAALG